MLLQTRNFSPAFKILSGILEYDGDVYQVMIFTFDVLLKV